jgi:REP element-mobilizing transposase RayT
VSRRTSSRIWQRNYWEHVVRTEKEADAVRVYIEANPSRWANDRENPGAPHP